jgi:hypothetical protein
MDGVIADLNGYYRERYNTIPRNDKEFPTRWKDEIYNHKMFANLPVLEEGKGLIEFLMYCKTPVTILSCATNEDYEEVSQQKTEWLKKNGMGQWPRIYVKRKPEKAVMANKQALLIDDSEACIEPFQEAGGNVIQFFNSEEAIKLLNEFGVNEYETYIGT